MGEMADFTNDDRMDEVEDYLDNLFSHPTIRYEHGHIDELGWENPPKIKDLIPPSNK